MSPGLYVTCACSLVINLSPIHNTIVDEATRGKPSERSAMDRKQRNTQHVQKPLLTNSLSSI